MNGSSVIIILILIAILIPAIRSSIHHLKGEGDCCGGPREKVVKKRLEGKVIATWTVPVSGMHCVNCKNRLERKLNELPRVIAAVNLDKKQAVLKLYDGAKNAELEEMVPEYIRAVGYTPGDIRKR